MDIILDRVKFMNALSVGGAFSGNNRAFPITDCVKVKVNGRELTIVSTDSSNAVNKSISLEEEFDSTSFCVNKKDLETYIKSIRSPQITLEVGEKLLLVRHEKGYTEFPLFDVTVFPLLSFDKDYREFDIDAALLISWIACGINFAGNDNLRPVMNGILIYAEDGELGCCATNGMSLFTDNIECSTTLDVRAIISRNCFAPLLKVISKSDKVQIRVSERKAFFSVDDCHLMTVLHEGRFPNFRSVIPNNSHIRIEADKDELIEALNHVCISMNESTGEVILDVKGMEMNVSCQNFELNKKSVDSIFVNSNNEIKIGVKLSSMNDIVNSIDSDKVVMEMSNPSKAIIFRESNDESRKIFLLMPMNIDN